MAHRHRSQMFTMEGARLFPDVSRNNADGPAKVDPSPSALCVRGRISTLIGSMIRSHGKTRADDLAVYLLQISDV